MCVCVPGGNMLIVFGRLVLICADLWLNILRTNVGFHFVEWKWIGRYWKQKEYGGEWRS